MPRRNERIRLEDTFSLSEDYLQRPQVEELRPGLITAVVKETGEDRTLKIWWKAGDQADGEFRELWNHERLQVDRVMNYPDADEVMVEVIEMIETSDSFCVVYEAAATPLAARLRTLSSRHWLKGLDIVSNRAILWNNLSRLAKAIGLLHAQGLVHGRLDWHAVFTNGSNSADFKLGGFEWCVGMGEAKPLDPMLAKARARIDRLIYSYGDDWKALGALFADILGVDVTRLRSDDPFQRGRPIIDLSEGEIDFLRRLTDPHREDAADARWVMRSVDALLRELVRFGTTKAARFILLARPNRKMAEAIDQATDGGIPIDDFDGQIAYIEGDIASGAKIVVSNQNDLETLDTLTIITEALSYRVRQFTDEGPPTWQIATVVSIVPRDRARLPGDREVHRLSHEVLVARNKHDALALLGRLRSMAIDWTIPIVPPKVDDINRESVPLQRAVLLVQVVEALVKSLDILPVSVASAKTDGGRNVVRLAPRLGTARDNLAAEIEERNTAEVMDRLFEKEDLGTDVDWRLSVSGTLSSKNATEIRARFLGVVEGPNGSPLYEFEVLDLIRDEKNLFLKRSGEAGTEALIRRRLRTTKALGEQRDLASLFVDLRRRIRSSQDVLVEDSEYRDLDGPKREALEQIWKTLPNHLVVGPPGVGKTRLSAEVVRRRLEGDPAARILLSAQSHQALDHLLSTVRKKVVAALPETIIVRSRGGDDSVSTDEDLRKTAASYLDRVLSSALISEAPGPLQLGISSLKEAVLHATFDDEGKITRPLNRREEIGLRALDALVLESANVVFSTSNSFDVERLCEDGAQFDWVLIEEAAKATGPELIAPLSLSGRRLLIGDHHQLPPFDAERLTSILSNNTAVRNALQQVEHVLGATFFESGLDELRSAVRDEAVLETTTQLALRMLEPFRSLVEEEERKRAVAGGQRRTVSSELWCQHRMDPAIAELVSRCFYKNRLYTGDDRIESAKLPLPFTFDSKIPSSPIVFIDMPFASRSGRAEPVEKGRPRWHNPSERRIVLEILRRLQVADLKPAPADLNTLAVLSPYRAQVERMARDLDILRDTGASSLAQFSGFTHDSRMHGTVDSSQGSEADLVIVSLVRNNHRIGVASLGFLRDPRRMNVLLSRAKMQLIVVGSLEFLKESTRHASAVEQDDLAFIRLFLDTLEHLTTQKACRGGPAAVVTSAADALEGVTF
ncbi:AAA domain-containing protein [Mesorhizobium sp. M1295]|uniref:AAA domain-containing protein n=1 Tax=Mesorhizobium sp. M1295 TaxID=2957076 RepID=UPI00333BE4E9